MITRRVLTAIVAATLAAGMVAACNPNSNEDDSGDGSGTGKTLVVARTGDIDKLDPALSTAFQTVQTLGLVYGRLVTTDAQGKIIPDLAEKWQIAPDGKQVTFTLRKDVKWHNGDPFVAADVKATIERILDEKTAAVGRSNLLAIQSVEATDDSTVVMKLKEPNAALLYALSSVNASILHVKDITAGTVAQKPNGTGPFTFDTWNQGQQLTLKANSTYYDGAPKLGSIQMRVIPSESSILAGMRAGTFTLGLVSDPGVAKQAGSDSKFGLVKQPSLSYHAFMLNGRRKPMDNLKFRQAIACAIDRQQVIDTAAFGDGSVTGPITSPAFQYDATKGLPCTPGDQNAAKRLLTESGVKTPVTINTIVQTGEYATSTAEGQNLQAQLAKIGVTLKLQQLPSGPYVDTWLAANYDAAVALNGGSSDPYLMYGRYFTTDGSLSKPAGLISPTLNQLLAKGNASTDENTRKQVYGQLQQQLLSESPWVWTFRSNDYYLVSKGASGFTARPDASLIALAKTGLS